MTWDVLISTIPHRHERLCDLLAEFGRQWQPGFGVRVSRDNLERPVWASSEKWQELVDSSAADYVCVCDDDDWVAPDYVARITDALRQQPDYVGFRVNFTEDGRPMGPVEHSLRHNCWAVQGGIHIRDISHLNPVRRELAQLVSWRGTNDTEWADLMRATGKVRTEVWIDDEMYFYRRSTSDGYRTQRIPMSEPLPQLPAYPWLTVL